MAGKSSDTNPKREHAPRKAGAAGRPDPDGRSGTDAGDDERAYTAAEEAEIRRRLEDLGYI